jgi:UPF0716 family protein affecting phage T7 exclusion
MGIITGLIGIAIRITWFVCVGMWLGSAYLLLMFCMSPFHTLASKKVLTNTRKIMILP